MHWYADCPLKKKPATVIFASKKEPTSHPNNIPLGKDSRWKAWDTKKDDSAIKHVNVIQTKSGRGQTSMDKDTSPTVVPSLEAPLTPPPDDPEEIRSDICPTFAITKIDKDEGILHKLCIDTGSSISCIDYDYSKKHLANHEIKHRLTSASWELAPI